MNKLTRKSISLLLSGTLVLGAVSPFTYASTQIVINSGDNLVGFASTFNTIFNENSTEDGWIYPDWAVGGGICFEKETGTIVDAEWSIISVNIPAIINGVTVDTIGESAFHNCFSLESARIPNTVTKIENNAFVQCHSLTDIIIPDNVIIIEYSAFADCYSLDTLTLPNSPISIGNFAFYGCTSLNSVIIPNLVSSIGLGSFASCENLTDVFFTGTLEQWENLDSENISYLGKTWDSEMALLEYHHDVTIHYSSIMPEVSAQEIIHLPLENATLHTSYLTAVHDINASSTLISGNLPKGLGLYADGVIGGVPQETGTFEFVIATSQGEVGYSITVEEPTGQNVEVNNDFDIIERVPTVDSNEKEYIFEVTGEFSDFLNVYLDGELLVKDVHYFSEEGSTKITIAAQTMSQLDSGSHTINAVFTTTNTTITPSSSSGSSSSSGTVTTTNSSKSANVASVAQVFEKTVEPAPMMAMPFSDVAVSDWHYQYVRYMYDTSTFSGVTDTTYEPDTGMTRGMMAVVFYGMADKPSTGSAGFSDVVDGEWYADAVNWMSTSGIDDSIGTFRPTDLITREETAKMMYNFCTDQGIFIPLTTSRTPSDMNSVSETAKNAVNILFSKGIFAGDDANNFNPHNTSTRAEISAMMRTFMWATV